MNIDNKNASTHHQDHPHQEGNQNNTPPIHEFDGQRRSNNNNQQMSNMMNESEEQKAGKAHGQKDESSVQQDERTP
ncbi:MAG: hypothetical protein ACJ749_17855 [Flavisolibacter sp.]